MPLSFDLTPYGVPHVLTPGFDFYKIKQSDLRKGTRAVDAKGNTGAFYLGSGAAEKEYIVNEMLGEGSYGIAYKVTDPEGKMYAIKFIKQKLAEKKEFVAFLKECIVQMVVVEASKTKTDGPYAPRIFEICYDTTHNEGFIRSELMRSKLDDLIAANVPAANDLVVPDALKQISKIIEDLQGSIKFNHRDMKGDNIMYVRSADGTRRLMRLIDFGMSCITVNGMKISGSTWFDEKHSCFKKDRDLSQLIFYIVTYHHRHITPELQTRLQKMIQANVKGKKICQMEKFCPRYRFRTWRNVYDFVDRPNVSIPGSMPDFVAANMNRFMRGDPFVAPAVPAAAHPGAHAVAVPAVKVCPTGKVLNPKTRRCVKARPAAGAGKVCPYGKVLNPKTRRCVKVRHVVAPGAKVCPPGKVLNPKTRRCVKDRPATAAPKICPPGKVLNPKTGRCVNEKGGVARRMKKTRKLRR